MEYILAFCNNLPAIVIMRTILTSTYFIGFASSFIFKNMRMKKPVGAYVNEFNILIL